MRMDSNIGVWNMVEIMSNKARGLLEVAKCPQCDGSGAYYDSGGEPCQCQWCFERKEVLNFDNTEKSTAN